MTDTGIVESEPTHSAPERIDQAAEGHEVAVGRVGAAILLPHHVYRRPWAILPTQHDIAAPAAHVEVAERQRELRRSPPSTARRHRAVGDRNAAVGVFHERRAVRAIPPQMQRARTRQLAESIPSPAGRKRLAIHLERKVRLQRVVEAQRADECGLIDERKDVSLPERLWPAVAARPEVLTRVLRSEKVR